MIACKACNTRFAAGHRACPNCGRSAPAAPRDAAGAESKRNVRLPLAASSKPAKKEVDLELEDVAVVEDPTLDEPEPRKRSARARPSREPGPTVLNLSPVQVRTLVVEQPALLESGLRIYTDENGDPVGIDFPTAVGDIDLLARDRAGHFVVVSVPAPSELDQVVPETLRRVGWVTKHLAGRQRPVRAIVVAERLPEDVAYAAAAVSGTLTFKTFRVALTFHDLEI